MTCSSTRLVDRHFAGGLGLPDERRLREHLPTCDACRARYERQLLLARLDPKAVSAQARLASGLGLWPRPSRRRLILASGGALATLAACALLFVALPRSDGFTARGRDTSMVVAYRLQDQRAEVLEDTMTPHDELAFAYDNAEGYSHLMVFAVDAHDRLYWYHPAWLDPSSDPVAVAVDAEPRLVELPAAVRHELSVGSLRLVALFLHEPVTVRQVEEIVARHGLDGLGSAFSRARLIVRPIDVEVRP